MGKYKDDWDRSNTTQFKLKLNNNKDRDIIEWLGSLDNKQGEIKELIRGYRINKEEGGEHMALENRLGITGSAELARKEEELTKKRAAEVAMSKSKARAKPIGFFHLLLQIFL